MSKIAFWESADAFHVRLNDPPLNILDLQMLGELRDVIDMVDDRKPLVMIEAAGTRAFSAGASVQDHLGDRVVEMLRRFHESLRALYALPNITVALVRGMALGGGCELALCCDFVLATPGSRFGLPEIKLGVFPPVAAYQLSRLLPPRIGLELLLSGEPISAEEARSLGLVNALFSPDDFDASVSAWLQRIVRHSPSSLRFAKRAFRLGSPQEFEGKLAAIEKLYLDELAPTHDATEGLIAFLEKREPSWKGE